MEESGTEQTVAPESTEAVQTPESDDPGLIGVLDLLVPLIRRRRLLLGFAVAGLLLGILWSLRKGLYVAETTVLPPQASVTSSLLGQIGSLAGLVGGSGLTAQHGSQDLYVSLIQSPSVQDAVVHRFNLDKVYKTTSPGQARDLLTRHCTVDGSGRDGMIRILVRDPDDPKLAADVANGYVDEFIKFMSHLAVGEAAQRRLFFEEQMQKEKGDLTEAEENLRKTEQKTGAVQLDAQTRALVESAANLRAQVAAKQVQIESIRAYAGPENINLQRAQQELAELRSQLARVSSSGADAGDSMAVSRTSIPQTALDNIRAQRDVKYHEAIFGILSNQYEAARLDEAREGTAVQIVEPATVPEARSSTPALKKITVTTLIGIFLGIMYVLAAYAWEHMRANRLFAGRLTDLRNAYTRKA